MMETTSSINPFAQNYFVINAHLILNVLHLIRYEMLCYTVAKVSCFENARGYQNLYST